MPKKKQASYDEYAAQNRRSIENELFEFRNRSGSEEYIKQFDKVPEARGSTVKEEDIAKKADATAKSIRKQSDDFWRDYFQHKGNPNNQSKANVRQNNKGKGGRNASIFDGQEDGLDKSNWETWWIRSPLWRRFIGFFLAIILIIFLAQLATAFFLLSSTWRSEAEDPYVCKTENCKYLSDWFKDSSDFSVSPCQDFYQFVCGNHKDENDDGLFDYKGTWDLYSAPLEFGRQNVLGLRKQSRFKEYRNLAERLFGDLNEIDTSTKSIEDMAVEVVKTVGDFGLFEFEFDGYPTILLTTLVFDSWVRQLKEQAGTRDSNLTSLITKLFPNLKKVHEISEGVLQILEMSYTLYTNAIKGDKEEACQGSSKGQPFDLNKVLDTYAEEKIEEKAVSSEIDEVYYDSLTSCWNISIPAEAHKKSSFAIFWMLRILIYSLPDLSSIEFGFLEPYLNSTDAYIVAAKLQQETLEHQCFHSVTRSLGYIPLHRYFEELELDSVAFGEEIESLFRRNSLLLNTFWSNTTSLPHIDSFYREEGSKILSFEDPVFFLSNIPSQNDLALENIADLELTNDHFKNSINGKMFTLRQAKDSWTKVHDKRHVLLWNSKTFDLEKAYYTIAPTDKVNSIFFPINFFLEPYDSDILAIRNGGSTVTQVRKILDYLQEYLGKENLKKKYEKDQLELLKNDGSEEPCTIFYYNQSTNETKMTNITKTKLLYDEHYSLFANVLAIKVSHFDSVDRKLASSKAYHELSPKFRKWELSKILVDFGDFTEEQLFFMALTRHFCRQRPSPGQPETNYKNYVTNMLAAFMQLDEFSTAWKCPPGARMNPPQKCFIPTG